MAHEDKKYSKYIISYPDFKKSISKGNLPNNFLLFISEKVLLTETLQTIGEKFIGKTFKADIDVNTFYSDDKNIEAAIGECVNVSMFSAKKMVVYKVIKRPGVRGLTLADKEKLLNYISNPNPDALLIILIADKEFTLSNFEEFTDKKISFSVINSSDERGLTEWIKEKFGDYEITDDTISYLLQFVNKSFDEVISEIEKLKTFCFESKQVNRDAVNLCVGISKDFKEVDFLEAVFTRNKAKALQIYDNLTLKEGNEIFLLILLNSGIVAANKLKDASVRSQSHWNLIRELKCWFEYEKLIPVYARFSSEINELKIKEAFDYIYQAEKSLKTVNTDKKTVFAFLIDRITSL